MNSCPIGWKFGIQPRAFRTFGERTFFSEFGGYGNFVVNEPPFSRDAAYVLMDSAHQYASANAAWLLTGDPYYLRCMQGVTNSHLLQDGYHRINQKLDGLLYPGQTRSFAWGLRDLSLLACTTPVSTPISLHRCTRSSVAILPGASLNPA